MVPVLDVNKIPLMPCTEKRARLLIERNQARSYWQKGNFCIKLLREPSTRSFQEVALGIDPGSKREGYTVATKKSVVINITTDTPGWVKEKIETRRNLRRLRRFRKTPYRECRPNRSTLRNKGRIPPSTKARWNAKLRIIKSLIKIIPIKTIIVEDIKAITKKWKTKWNVSFSPLEVGKNWFYSEIENLGVKLIKVSGFKTSEHRKERGFKKLTGKGKMDYTWESHNVDSHALCEMALNEHLMPFLGIWQINFLNFYRRQLHVQNPAKGGIRKIYGSTLSLGLIRGSIIKYKKDGLLYYIGGASKKCVAIHSVITKKRANQFAQLEDIEMICYNKQRTQFLPRLKTWVSLLRRS